MQYQLGDVTLSQKPSASGVRKLLSAHVHVQRQYNNKTLTLTIIFYQFSPRISLQK